MDTLWEMVRRWDTVSLAKLYKLIEHELKRRAREREVELGIPPEE